MRYSNIIFLSLPFIHFFLKSLFFGTSVNQNAVHDNFQELYFQSTGIKENFLRRSRIKKV